MSKVEVLCPNGRRVTVKVAPTTKILQILEEACSKQGFVPASDYELKHGRRSLDVTLSVQFAALPNLAKLELVKLSKSRTDAPVLIALQTANGQRMQAEFLPTTSLWQVLEHFDNARSDTGVKLTSSSVVGEHAVCIYMNDEIVSEFALKQTTLRSLGLTAGRAIVRHVFRPVSDQVIAEIIDRIERENQRQSRLAAAAAAAAVADANWQSASSSSHVAMETTSVQQSPDVSAFVAPATHMSSSPLPSPAVVPPSTSESFQPMDVENVTSVPAPVSGSNPDSNPRHRDNTLQFAPPPRPQFVDFKFPEETKGKNLYHNELSDVNREEFKPCDRETVVYSLDDIEPELVQAAGEEIPDEFFEVTEADIRKLWQDMQRRTSELQDQPLMTQTQRQQNLEAKMARYKRVVIRFQFPDRLVVQGIFRTTEPVFNLYKFIRENISDKTLPFELYTSPPKAVLKDNTLSLAEADLAPMSVVYFGSSVKLDHYLSDAVLCTIDSQRSANLVLVKLNQHAQSDTASSPSTTGASSRPISAASSGGSGKSGAGNVPKWFKVGHK